jgi:transposase
VRSLAAERTSLTEARAEIERLRLVIKKLQRSQFGRRAERLDEDQFQLGLDDLSADLAQTEARLPSGPEKTSTPKPPDDRPSLPAHLAREDVRLDLGHQACPCCGGELHLIGETVSEMLDHVPARLRVIRIRRPRYGCRACDTIHQAPASERPIAKGLATPALLAHVLVSKYCDHLPLYRQSQIFARQDVELDRSTLANWVGGAVWWLDPGRGRTKTGRLWVYARDDRPWCGPDPPAALYLYSPDRRAERPASHLTNFKGVVHVDAYPGFDRLSDGGNIQLAACWAHARRKFYEVHEATGSPVAAEALRRIAELYVIETAIRSQAAGARRAVRRIRSLPLVTAMKTWLEAELHRIPPRGALAEAIRYALTRWTALCCFLDDGRIALDNNTVERAIRPIALGRKNHLFAGSDGGAARWAVVASLLTTAKLNNVEPFAYLRDALERMSNGHPMSRLDDLLPWNWAQLRAAA